MIGYVNPAARFFPDCPMLDPDPEAVPLLLEVEHFFSSVLTAHSSSSVAIIEWKTCCWPRAKYAGGHSLFETASVTSTYLILDPGDSNMASERMRSITVRNPRAPVFIAMADLAIWRRAGEVKRSSTPLRAKSSVYCFRRAFRGSVRTRTSISSSRDSTAAIMGIRPTFFIVVSCQFGLLVGK